MRSSETALRALRKRAGLNRDVLALAIGRRRTGTIANYEQGRRFRQAEDGETVELQQPSKSRTTFAVASVVECVRMLAASNRAVDAERCCACGG